MQKSQADSSPSESITNRRSWMKGAAVLASGTVAAELAPAFPATGEKESGKTSDRIIASDSKNVVETNAGKVRGYTREGIHTFKGIPYGASTEGKNRFMPPVKPAPWAGLLSTMNYAHVCPYPPRTDWKNDETAFMFQWNDGQPGEDCLRINVWTPGTNDNRKRPVMVWLHGGGFSFGSGQELLSLDGENLARRGDVVVLTLNHRLNTFGFLNLAEFGGSQYEGSGNVGMVDLVFALEWVRDNIASFGGDPGNVTIFGQSGGGGKVSTLLAMPSAKGLFHRAIVQSGATLKVSEASNSAKLAAAVLDELNISKSDVEKLRSVPMDHLLNAALAAEAKMAPPLSPSASYRRRTRDIRWGPMVDGKIIPGHPFDPVAPGVSAGVPLLVGTVLNEFTTAMNKPDAFSMTDAQLEERIKEVYGDRCEEIVQTFKKGHPNARPFDLYSIIGTCQVRHNAVKQAQLKAALNQAPAFNYWFTWQTPILDGRPMAFHCSELPFCFYNSDRCENMTGGGPRARALAAKVSDAWINFARKGDPNHSGLPKWAPVGSDKVTTMIFDDTCVARNDPDGPERRLMESVG